MVTLLSLTRKAAVAAPVHETPRQDVAQDQPLAALVLPPFDLPAESSSAFRQDQHPAGTSRQDTRRVLHAGNYYASCHEAACGEMLERYVPGFRIEPGRSFQIRAADSRLRRSSLIDFMVDGILVEYHPIRLKRAGGRSGDFQNRREYIKFHNSMVTMNSAQRERFIEQTQKMLSARYFSKRQALIKADDRLRGKLLIVAANPEQFYDRVIRCFGQGYPEKPAFVDDFQRLVHVIAEKNPGYFNGNHSLAGSLQCG